MKWDKFSTAFSANGSLKNEIEFTKMNAKDVNMF